MFAGFIMVITAQLSLLNDSLKNLHTFSSHEGKPTVENINEEAMIKNIIKCVHNHQEILKFTKEIESLFTVATFGQFSISVLILCTTLFKLASLEKNNLEFFSLVLYIFVITSEVFIFCYFGNEVITKHNELTNSAYHSEWRNCSKTFRKNLIFFMTRSQKTLRLLAGGYVTLSLETFVAVTNIYYKLF
ncbi:unnamed protein product [Psylliodes chrysocephalus]|uniref:Uncharacterized protein n=1 Tax=Psylliodes chrysocephalus TaxID=3402493 RepID=A0A9P0DD17_9CUCU|nr:unnamed protein product [Psylliodes chrysocephala]